MTTFGRRADADDRPPQPKKGAWAAKRAASSKQVDRSEHGGWRSDRDRQEAKVWVERQRDDNAAMAADKEWAEFLRIYPTPVGPHALGVWRLWNLVTTATGLDIGQEADTNGRCMLLDVSPEGVLNSASQFAIAARRLPLMPQAPLYWLHGGVETPEKNWWFFYDDGGFPRFTPSGGVAELNVVMQAGYNRAHRQKMRRQAGILIKDNGLDNLRRLLPKALCFDSSSPQSSDWAIHSLSHFYPHLANGEVSSPARSTGPRLVGRAPLSTTKPPSPPPVGVAEEVESNSDDGSVKWDEIFSVVLGG